MWQGKPAGVNSVPGVQIPLPPQNSLKSPCGGMVDTLALGASVVRRNGSSPFEGTTFKESKPIGDRDCLLSSLYDYSYVGRDHCSPL